jgi:hypothetical protein
MYLHDICLYADDELVELPEFRGGFVLRFHRETLCVADHLGWLLSKRLKTATRKIVLYLTLDPMKVKMPHGSFDVMIACQQFDFYEYLSAEVAQKKELILRSIEALLKLLCDEYGWDYTIVREACEEIRKKEFVFGGIVKHSWLCPRGLFRVRLRGNSEIDGVEIFAQLYRNRRKEMLVEKWLGKLPAGPGWATDYLGKEAGSWTSDSEFRIQSLGFARQQLAVDFSEFVGCDED